ncbi:hypothetical protein DSECCO2_388970 [anaerobic digester metagenome]
MHRYIAFRVSFSRTLLCRTLLWPKCNHVSSENTNCIGIKSTGTNMDTSPRITISRGIFQTYTGIGSNGTFSGYAF